MIHPVTEELVNSHFLRGKGNEKTHHPSLGSHAPSFGMVLHYVAPHNESMKMAESHSMLLPPDHQSLNTK